MEPMTRTSIVPRWSLALILGLSFIACLMLVLLRYGLTRHFSQGYLVWNLFLAAVPIGIAWLGEYGVARCTSVRLAPACGFAAFLVWLLFFPNAPYLFTDFIHVVRKANLGYVAADWLSPMDLLWYDIVMNSAFSFVGHYMGLVSVYIMHGTMMRLFGRPLGWAMMLPAVLLSGFGIHLGRFSRLNSWDLFLNPLEAISAIGDAMAVPSALLFSLVFAFFIGLTYLIFYISKRGHIGGFDKQD
jgi:uncharacterized membrane protein